jgi:hypothetical protein
MLIFTAAHSADNVIGATLELPNAAQRIQRPANDAREHAREPSQPAPSVCLSYHHEAAIDADGYDGALPVKSFEPRMVGTHCGAIGADVRPNWSDKPPRPSLLGRGLKNQ